MSIGKCKINSFFGKINKGTVEARELRIQGFNEFIDVYP